MNERERETLKRDSQERLAHDAKRRDEIVNRHIIRSRERERERESASQSQDANTGMDH